MIIVQGQTMSLDISPLHHLVCQLYPTQFLPRVAEPTLLEH